MAITLRVIREEIAVGRHGPDNGNSLALLQGQQLAVLQQYRPH
eukprot:COSAG04_NODE_30908_length_260_cov_0.608696_1_plen_42_part_10